MSLKFNVIISEVENCLTYIIHMRILEGKYQTVLSITSALLDIHSVHSSFSISGKVPIQDCF